MQEDPAPGVLSEVYHSKAWRLYPTLFLLVTSVGVLLPLKPEIFTDFFAGIPCGGYGRGLEPEECQNAHSTSVSWTAGSDFINNSVVLFLCVRLLLVFFVCFKPRCVRYYAAVD